MPSNVCLLTDWKWGCVATMILALPFSLIGKVHHGDAISVRWTEIFSISRTSCFNSKRNSDSFRLGPHSFAYLKTRGQKVTLASPFKHHTSTPITLQPRALRHATHFLLTEILVAITLPWNTL